MVNPKHFKQPEPELHEVDCPELSDVSKISVKELEVAIIKIKAKYGANAVLLFDAGYNNISVDVLPSKKVK